MKCEKLFEIIKSRAEEYVDVWEKFALIESPTEYKDGVDAAGEYIASLARELRFEVKKIPEEAVGDVVVITMNGESGEAPIVFSGHIDTVHPIGSFGNPAVKRKNGNIYGPGVMDCKGGVVAAFAAMHALRDAGFKDRPIKLILQTDEEKNSRPSMKDTIRIMLEESGNAVAFLNCESIIKNTAVLMRKGIIQFEFEVTGKAMHSSKCPSGISAVTEAAHKIIELEKMKDIDGLTCNCGLISGGTAENTVAEKCVFTADIRFSNDNELETARNTVYEVAKKSYVGGTCTVTERPYRPAMVKTDKNLALLDKLNKIYSANCLPNLSARLSLGGSDAAYTTEAGIPTVDSIGVAGDYIHTVNEYAVISSLEEATQRLASAVYCFDD